MAIERSVKFTDDSSRAGKACHVTIPTDDKAHETEQQAYVVVADEVASACNLNVL